MSEPPFFWWDHPPFKNCSLIGSSSSLRGARLGPLIDSFDTVVRINRMAHDTSKDLERDLGKRTDVLFTTLCNIKPNATLWVPIQGRPSSSTAENHVECSLRTGKGCRFNTLIMRGPPACGPLMFRLRGQRLAVPVAIQSETLVREARTLVSTVSGRGDRFDVSTGFHAVLTMAMHCASLTVFGFDGNATYDSHEITAEHLLGVEHRIIHALTRGPLLGLPSGWRGSRLTAASVQEYSRLLAIASQLGVFDLKGVRRRSGLRNATDAWRRSAHADVTSLDGARKDARKQPQLLSFLSRRRPVKAGTRLR